MSEYRKIYYPKCPYCKYEVPSKIDSYNYSKLVSMATGSGSSDVIITCDCCRMKYRVTCTIKYNVRRVTDADSN